MPEENNDTNGSIGADLSVLESLLDPEMRLVKKYLLDSEGRLRLYHPVTQRVLFSLIKDKLLAEAVKYHKVQKDKDKKGK